MWRHPSCLAALLMLFSQAPPSRPSIGPPSPRVPGLTNAQPCQVQGPPQPEGSSGYAGNGHQFDYTSDSGSPSGKTHFQHVVRNTGHSNLSFEWVGAFSRAGVPNRPPDNEAKSECFQDGNPANISTGTIWYGPMTQFEGPNARFYSFQPRPASATAPGTFRVFWRAHLDQGVYDVDVQVTTTAALADRILRYTFVNNGMAVLLEWPAVLDEAALKAALNQNAGLQIRPPSKAPSRGTDVRGSRIVLAPKTSIGIELRGVTVGNPVYGPLTVYSPETDLMLYKDVFAGVSTPR